jgi:hypothetical protein
MLGRKIFASEKIIEGNSFSIQLDATIADGIYLLTLQSSQSSSQKLFEVQRR